MKTVGVVAGLGRKSSVGLHRSYVDAVAAAGAMPVLLPGTLDAARTDRVVDMIDGLLLVGGGDIHPKCYGAGVGATLYDVDDGRDEVELRLVHRATRAGRRVLGICRGAQVLAVAHGGSLMQDLPASDRYGHVADTVGAGYASLSHPVETARGTLAAKLLGGSARVNTQHHQAISDPGSLVASAWSPDGVIEAVEGGECLGVQWHPELLFRGDASHFQLFTWLVGSEMTHETVCAHRVEG